MATTQWVQQQLRQKNRRFFSAPALLVAGAFFMEFLDGTVIATALPDMAKDFWRSGGRAQYWHQRLPDHPRGTDPRQRLDRRPLRRAESVYSGPRHFFTLASVFCGLSRNIESFVTMRILQGRWRRADGPRRAPGGIAHHSQRSAHQGNSHADRPALVAPIIGPPLGGFHYQLRQLALDLFLLTCRSGYWRWRSRYASFPISVKKNAAPSIYPVF